MVETARRGLAVGTTLAATLVGDGQAVLGGGPKQLLADWLRITTAEAKHRLDHAARIDERTTLTGQSLPPLMEATAAQWHAGVLDEEHLKVILDFVNDLPADVDPDERDRVEVFLAEESAKLRPDQLKGLADTLAISINPDGVFTEADRQRQRGLSWAPQRRHGMSKGTLWATPELRAGLDAHFAHGAAPGMNNPAEESPCSEGEADPEAAARDIRTPGQRRHDALNALVRRQLGDPNLGKHRDRHRNPSADPGPDPDGPARVPLFDGVRQRNWAAVVVGASSALRLGGSANCVALLGPSLHVPRKPGYMCEVHQRLCLR